MGIAEATYRIARDYAASRAQFGGPIEKLPAVRDMTLKMKTDVEAGRALLCETCRVVDLEIGLTKIAEGPDTGNNKEAVKGAKQQLKKIKRLAALLTPMSKYYCSEMCNRVAYDSMQVLGGSGYMRDYACERHARDARITTIYEGTSQLQVVAAVRGVCGGTGVKYLEELAAMEYVDGVKDLIAVLDGGRAILAECVAFVKEQGIDYMDLYGRGLVDIAISLIIGYLFCGQASSRVAMNASVAEGGQADAVKTIPMTQRKEMVARRWVCRNAAQIKALAEEIKSGDRSTFRQYEAIVGPVPEIG
jgi:hypothetical protein